MIESFAVDSITDINADNKYVKGISDIFDHYDSVKQVVGFRVHEIVWVSGLLSHDLYEVS